MAVACSSVVFTEPIKEVFCNDKNAEKKLKKEFQREGYKLSAKYTVVVEDETGCPRILTCLRFLLEPMELIKEVLCKDEDTEKELTEEFQKEGYKLSKKFTVVVQDGKNCPTTATCLRFILESKKK